MREPRRERRLSVHLARCVTIGLVLGLLGSCDGGLFNPGSGGTVARGSSCSGQTYCVLAVNVLPLRAARWSSDSATIGIPLGTFTVRGSVGDSVRLQGQADAAVLDQLADSVTLIVTVGDRQFTEPLAAALAGRTIYTFPADGEAVIRYRLARKLGAMPNGSFYLQQDVFGAAVLKASTPWATQALGGLRLASGSGTPCAFDAPGTYCGDSLTISPYVLGSAFAPDQFQSVAGNGFQTTITIAFAIPVDSFAITVYDPDYPGNEVVALDSAGNTLATVAVQGDGIPNQLTSQDVVIGAAGIKTILLVPNDTDYVAYGQASFSRHCPPTTDAALNDPGVRAAFANELVSSKSGGAHEVAGAIYFNPTTQAFQYDTLVTNNGACETGALTILPGQNGFLLYGFFHVHPDTAGAIKTCMVEGHSVTAAYDPYKWGGGSPADWHAVDSASTAAGYDLRSYTGDYSNKVWRLDPHTDSLQWGANPNIWRNRGDACYQ